MQLRRYHRHKYCIECLHYLECSYLHHELALSLSCLLHPKLLIFSNNCSFSLLIHLLKVCWVIKNGCTGSGTWTEWPSASPSHTSHPVYMLHDLQPVPQSIFLDDLEPTKSCSINVVAIVIRWDKDKNGYFWIENFRFFVEI